MEDLYFKNHEARLIFGLVMLSKKNANGLFRN